jgi:hypothetical protein
MGDGKAGVCIGQVCMSVSLAAGGMIFLLYLHLIYLKFSGSQTVELVTSRNIGLMGLWNIALNPFSITRSSSHLSFFLTFSPSHLLSFPLPHSDFRLQNSHLPTFLPSHLLSFVI